MKTTLCMDAVEKTCPFSKCRDECRYTGIWIAMELTYQEATSWNNGAIKKE